MELRFALLADAANVSQEGKLNICGEFNVIHSNAEPPIAWPHCVLVVRVEASISEGTQHTFRLGIFDEDGGAMLPVSPEIPLKFSSQGPGLPLRGQVLMNFGNLAFPRFGTFEFHVLIDGHSCSRGASLCSKDKAWDPAVRWEVPRSGWNGCGHNRRAGATTKWCLCSKGTASSSPGREVAVTACSSMSLGHAWSWWIADQAPFFLCT